MAVITQKLICACGKRLTTDLHALSWHTGSTTIERCDCGREHRFTVSVYGVVGQTTFGRGPINPKHRAYRSGALAP